MKIQTPTITRTPEAKVVIGRPPTTAQVAPRIDPGLGFATALVASARDANLFS